MTQFQPHISEQMETNVGDIIGVKTGSHPGDSMVNIKIAERPKRSNYDIQVLFHGINTLTKKKYELSPNLITLFSVNQNYDINWLDDIELEVTLFPKDLLLLIYNSQDLLCDVTIRSKGQNDGIIDGIDTDEDPILTLENYHAIFKTDQDIRKLYPKEMLVPSDTEMNTMETTSMRFDHLRFQLIDDVSYGLRTKRMNFMARDLDMRDAIITIVAKCGIKKIAIVDPDNKTKYKNFIIPPTLTLPEVMEFLQSYYGVYDKGFGFYYTDETFFVYPKFETDPQIPPTPKPIVHFYYVGENKYQGLEVNHAIDKEFEGRKGNTHIVVNTATDVQDKTKHGMENVATGFFVQHDDRVIDDWRYIHEPKGEHFATQGLGRIVIPREPNMETLIDKDEKIGVTKDSNNVIFTQSFCNIHKLKTFSADYRRSEVFFRWTNAVPDLFRPGYRIEWHYDDEDPAARTPDKEYGQESYRYTTRTGVVESVSYVFTPETRDDRNRYVFFCNADLLITIDKDEAEPLSKDYEDTLEDEALVNREASAGGGGVGSLSTGSQGQKAAAASTKQETKNETVEVKPAATSTASTQSISGPSSTTKETTQEEKKSPTQAILEAGEETSAQDLFRMMGFQSTRTVTVTKTDKNGTTTRKTTTTTGPVEFFKD